MVNILAGSSGCVTGLHFICKLPFAHFDGKIDWEGWVYWIRFIFIAAICCYQLSSTLEKKVDQGVDFVRIHLSCLCPPFRRSKKKESAKKMNSPEIHVQMEHQQDFQGVGLQSLLASAAHLVNGFFSNPHLAINPSNSTELEDTGDIGLHSTNKSD